LIGDPALLPRFNGGGEGSELFSSHFAAVSTPEEEPQPDAAIGMRNPEKNKQAIRRFMLNFLLGTKRELSVHPGNFDKEGCLTNAGNCVCPASGTT